MNEIINKKTPRRHTLYEVRHEGVHKRLYAFSEKEAKQLMQEYLKIKKPKEMRVIKI